MYRKLRVYKEERERSGLTAAALKYDPQTDKAPRVIASGKGKIAEHILALGKEHNVPIYDDPELAAALSMVDLEEEIPPELYRVVAEVLAYIYRVAEVHGKKRK